MNRMQKNKKKCKSAKSQKMQKCKKAKTSAIKKEMCSRAKIPESCKTAKKAREVRKTRQIDLIIRTKDLSLGTYQSRQCLHELSHIEVGPLGGGGGGGGGATICMYVIRVRPALP